MAAQAARREYAVSHTVPDRVAVIDDDPSFRAALIDLLESMSFLPAAFQSARDFLHAPDRSVYGCIISDIQMPVMTGFDLLKEVRRIGGLAPVILITARSELDLERKAQDKGAFALLRKPVDAARLQSLLQAVMKKGAQS